MRIETSKGKLPIKYDWWAFAQIGEQTGKSLTEVMTLDLPSWRLLDVLKFILVGFQEGAEDVGEECLVKSEKDVSKLMDKDPEFMAKIIHAVTEMTKAEGEPSEDKKK